MAKYLIAVIFFGILANAFVCLAAFKYIDHDIGGTMVFMTVGFALLIIAILAFFRDSKGACENCNVDATLFKIDKKSLCNECYLDYVHNARKGF